MLDDTRTLVLAAVMFTLIMTPLLYFFRAVLRFSSSLEVVDEGWADGSPRLRVPAVDYAMSTVIAASFEDVLGQTRAALREEGFGVVAEIDVADTFDAANRCRDAYRILEVWDADTMEKVLDAEYAAGLLMPARVIVFEVEGGTAVSAIDPRSVLDIADNPKLLPLAGEARGQLQRVIDRLDVGTVTLQAEA